MQQETSLPKVSIVVPIYKVEKYLRQCVDSILAQTLRDIEIILVDDGSPDACPAIVDEYAAQDPRVIAIHQPNGGYGKAVNTGIARASAPYIGIIESDDWIEPNMYEELLSKAEETGVDVVKSLFWFYNSQKPIKSQNSLYTKGAATQNLPTEPFAPTEYPPLFLCSPSLWSNLYKADFIKKLKLDESPSAAYQDFPFVMEVYSQAKKILFIKKAFVHYRLEENQNSSSTRSDGRLIQSPIMLYKAFQILKKYNILDKVKEEFFHHVFRANWVFLKKIQPAYSQAFYTEYRKLMLEAKGYPDLTFKYFTDIDLKHLKRIFKRKKVSSIVKQFRLIQSSSKGLTLLWKGQYHHFYWPWHKK